INTNVVASVAASTFGLTWSKGDKVTIYATAFIEAGVEIYSVKGASATASLTATAPRGHVDLTSFTFV
ncbi:MAG TPA: hypothetical protein VMH90_02550, partial [Thermoplasmata archaeon]|nr:hypothetical protein [Thermoplasmata archaeon]